MKTAMQTTSLEAFYGIQRELNRREKQLLEVLHVIQPASDRQLAKNLQWEIGSVNGRRNSLMQKGIVEVAYSDISETGRRVNFWRIAPQKGQATLL